MIITIDGPSGTGKSTVARRLAESLGIIYFNTGAMYRSFAYFLLAICKGGDFTDPRAIQRALKEFSFEVKEGRYFVDGHDVTEKLQGEKIAGVASLVSSKGEVREALLPIQRAFAAEHDIVCEGRDIGTVIFPSAEHKFFLTASAAVRAKRRWLELPERDVSVEAIQKEIEERDRRDTTRAIAPLRKADDACEIDTSSMNIEEVVELLLQKVGNKKA